jgi:pilus assembly protein FimV
VRKLGLIFSFWLAIFALPGNSFALGLGEIDVSSFLNQPLNAEIEVISARPGEIDDLLVSLASRDSFARAGLSRPDNLSELRFAVRKSEEGDEATILVTTRGAIKEPFLNFLVEADWSKGRVLREYTILLDPPFYADNAAPTSSSTIASEPAVEADTSQSSPPTVIANTTQAAISESIAESRVAPSNNTEVATSSSGRVSSDEVVVVKGDALWSIASRFKDQGHSMGQVMLAMQRANPRAFGNNNINNLKVGAVLRAPTGEELDQISQQEAYAQVLEQNGLWDDYVGRVKGTSVSVASDDGGSGGSTNNQETSGSLSLLTPGDGDSESTGQGSSSNELRAQLALAEEQLEASSIEKQDMQSRIADLEARLSKFDELQKMIEIEDDSLAQLQADQAEATVLPAPESLVEELQLADEDAALDKILAEGTVAGSGESVEISGDESSEVAVDEFDPETVVEEPVVAPPAPIIVTEVETAEPSIFDGILPPGLIGLLPSLDGILDDPIALGGLGGVVALLLGLILYKRRKGENEEDDGITVGDSSSSEIYGIEEDLTPIHLAEESVDPETNINVDILGHEISDDDAEDEFSRTVVISQSELEQPEAEPAPAEQDDVLNEIDVYLAYGLYDNAEELLKQSLDANPDRVDYRSKLLDTYFATKNSEEFIKEAELLKSMGSAGAKYWDKVQVMGYELAPDNELFSGGKDSTISAGDLDIAKPAVADFDLGASDDDTSFSTTDFNLGMDDNEFTSTQAVADTQELPELQVQDIREFEGLSNQNEELSDELGELEFMLDSETKAESVVDDISEINFELPDSLDLDLDDDENSLETVSLDFDMDKSSGEDLDEAEEDLEVAAVFDSPTDSDEKKLSALGSQSSQADNNLDFDIGDASAASEQSASDDDDIKLDLDETDEEVTFDIGEDDFDDEPLKAKISDKLETNLEEEAESLDLEDSLSVDLDLNSDNTRTGTFAPGDFDDPDELIIPEVDIDDIGDLMLPDDVDEVSTKLDLARAFIDMGDAEGARGSLDEVLAEGTDEQKAEATQLLKKI